MAVGLNFNPDFNMLNNEGVWDVKGGYDGMRFANEGNYNEWLLGYESDRDGAWWGGVYFRTAFQSPSFSAGWQILDNTSIVLPEAFMRLGFGDKGWNFWLGRRYNDKIALGMMDYYMSNLDADGFGVENISLGKFAILDFNLLFTYDNNATVIDPTNNSNILKNVFIGKSTAAFVLRGINAGPGELKFIIAPTVQGGGKVENVDIPYLGGAFLSARYDLGTFLTGNDGSFEFFGGYGFGSGANQAAATASIVPDGPATTAPAFDIGDWSVLGGVQGNVSWTEDFSAMMTLYYEHRSWESMKNFMSFGMRPMYKLTDIFGIQLEYDFEGAFDNSSYVNRFTLAPTFTPIGGGVKSGLQIFPYVAVGIGDFKGGDSVAFSNGGNVGMSWGVAGYAGF